jgi:hypothetical protein
MIRKFAAVPGSRVVPALMLFLTILAGARLAHAQQPTQQTQPQSNDQQTPAQAQPATQQQPENQPADTQQSGSQPTGNQSSANQSSGQQEASTDELGHRKVKPKDYTDWSFNVGGGGSLTNGTTKSFVRGGGGVAAAGAARNFNKYFGFRLDFQWDNLPLRSTALELGQAPSGTSHVYTFTFEPIINIPVTKDWGGYVLFGPAYFHRTGRLDSSTAIPGSTCDTFFRWWGRCYSAVLPLNGNFLSESVNQPGYDVGAGITHKILSNIEIYGEIRQMHGSHAGITTDFRPITVGVRW